MAQQPSHRQLSQPTGSLGQIKHHPRAKNSGKQVKGEAQNERDRKTLELIGADRKQHDTGD